MQHGEVSRRILQNSGQSCAVYKLCQTKRDMLAFLEGNLDATFFVHRRTEGVAQGALEQEKPAITLLRFVTISKMHLRRKKSYPQNDRRKTLAIRGKETRGD